MSAMRSASSSTTMSMPSRRIRFWLIRSARRPGQATTISVPRRSAVACRLMGTPPKMASTRGPSAPARRRSSLQTWVASSRVGTSTRRRGRLGRTRSTPTTSGMPKARVLPEPVGARPDTSRPSRTSGRVRAWMGKGSLMPRAAREAAMDAGTPRSANDLVTGDSCSRPPDRRTEGGTIWRAGWMMQMVVRRQAGGRHDTCNWRSLPGPNGPVRSAHCSRPTVATRARAARRPVGVVSRRWRTGGGSGRCTCWTPRARAGPRPPPARRRGTGWGRAGSGAGPAPWPRTPP